MPKKLKPIINFPKDVKEGDLVRIVVDGENCICGHALEFHHFHKPRQIYQIYIYLSGRYPGQLGDSSRVLYGLNEEVLGYESLRRAKDKTPLKVV